MTREIICPGIDDYMKPFFSYFNRSESRELAENYVTGLLIDGERKSVEPMSENLHASERSMQRLLSDVKWDDKGVAVQYRRNMLSATADPLGILVLDDTGFPKKGRDSACVARQYCGATGKTDNCQIGVSMTYVGCDVAWPYAMDLYIPESWDQTDNADCIAKRKKTRIPESAHYKPKWRIALDFIALARKDQVPYTGQCLPMVGMATYLISAKSLILMVRASSWASTPTPKFFWKPRFLRLHLSKSRNEGVLASIPILFL
jgi:SRSO17 transposase